MPGGDGTGPYGTYSDCVDPKTGLRRPLNRFMGSTVGRGSGRGRRSRRSF